MALTPATSTQIPDHAILDFFDKQTYLGNQFIFPFTFTQSGDTAAETPLILISNASTNKKALFLSERDFSTLGASEWLFRFYFNPTVTSTGTSQTPVNLRPAYQTLTPSIAALSTKPTVSAKGTLVMIIDSGALGNTTFYERLVILDPGSSLLMTASDVGAANDTCYVNTVWYEL